MTLYNTDDIRLLGDKLPQILENIEKQKGLLLTPTIYEQIEVHKVIMSYIKQNKNKIYGGFAINMLIKEKNPKDKFYPQFPLEENTKDVPLKIPDIDIYSAKPIEDLKNICNLLFEKGFARVNGKEALHSGSYKIFVDFKDYCDITYIPNEIYNRIPMIEIDGYRVCSPQWIMIDYMRMFSDPLLSYFRFDDDLKAFRRFQLLLKHYPFPILKNTIKLENATKETQKGLDIIHKFLLNRKTTLVIGYYAFNCFLYESQLVEDNKNTTIKYLPIPCFEFITINYKKDVLELLDLLKELNVEYKEYYAFIDYVGKNVKISINNTIIAIIYTHNERCLPYKEYQAFDFDGNIIEKKTILIGSFQITLLYALIMYMYARTYGTEEQKTRTYSEKSTEMLYKLMVSQLIQIREYFFTTFDKTFMDNTLFEEFTDQCTGSTISADRQNRLRIELKKKQNKMYMYNYDPEKDKDKESKHYIFPKINGKLINNPKNLLLTNAEVEEDEEDE